MLDMIAFPGLKPFGARKEGAHRRTAELSRHRRGPSEGPRRLFLKQMWICP